MNTKQAATAATERGHSIKIVAQRTGLSSHVIRVWERRYNAVSPRRTETNRRLYSDGDIERLKLLGEATQIGHTISNIAGLSDDELRDLIRDDRVDTPRPAPEPGGDPEPHLREAIEAASDLDADRLLSVLERSTVDLPPLVVLEDVIVPLMYKIGELWHTGDLRVVHEHAAYAVVASFIHSLKTTYAPPKNAPTVLVTTPTGELHELGALIAAATAAYDGWRPVYLGTSLPAEEIAKAVEHHRPAAIALSIVYRADESSLSEELRRLDRLIPDDVHLIVGGRSARDHREILSEIGATLVGNLRELREALDSQRAVSA